MKGFLAVLVAVLLAPLAAPQTPTKGSITGRVVDALGEGVVAAEVWAMRGGETDPKLARARTDGDGMFVLGGVPLGAGYVRVLAVAPGRTQGADYVTLDAAHPRADAELRLWDAGTIRARVVDAQGEPVAGASVCAAYDVSRVFGLEPQAKGATDEEGNVLLERVPLGYVFVRAWKDGFELRTEALWLRDESAVELHLASGGGRRLDVRVEGLPEGTTASIHVLPYANGGHQVLPAPLVRGEAAGGRWSVAGLPDFELRVSPSCAGFTFAPSEFRGEPGKGDHAVTFRATAASSVRVHGVLRDLAGAPLGGETVVCRRFNGGTRGTAVTDDEGRFDVECPLPPGESAVLHLSGSKYVVAQPKGEGSVGSWDVRFRMFHEFTVDPAAAIDLRAAPGASVAGRVVDGDGRPVRGRRVELQEASPNRTPLWMAFAYAKTDRDGEFEFRGLNPPERDLRVSPGDIGAGASEAFTLQFGARFGGLELQVDRAGVVEGVARDAKGEPVPGARVWLRNCDVATGRQTDGSVYEVLADRHGRFRHVGVEPGGHALQLLLEEAHPSFALVGPFEVGPGAVVSQEIGPAK